jgi:hypothetical protein
MKMVEKVLVNKKDIKELVFMVRSPAGDSSDAWDLCVDIDDHLSPSVRNSILAEIRAEIKRHPDDYEEDFIEYYKN